MTHSEFFSVLRALPRELDAIRKQCSTVLPLDRMFGAWSALVCKAKGGERDGSVFLPGGKIGKFRPGGGANLAGWNWAWDRIEALGPSQPATEKP